ncbi:hypothetical protein [Helicovermis profundi]|uniref:Uncharacterized protein n=1 Tax=Helicovermis profundi TaxID=3065157 RepID=A0AAU9EAV9_9FIRM|nr:hypothetical protein HLPR_13680 [Clostridia bacterium S502]
MDKFSLEQLIKSNYFYGKLLTVNDFEIEQEYINSKINLINKYVFGEGIIKGLNVVMIDDQTLSIEPGIAIDSFGKTIVVSKPITEKLSLIEGFEQIENTTEMFLTLEYNEELSEKIQVITNNEEDFSKENYNKKEETYKLILKSEGINEIKRLEATNDYTTQLLFKNNNVELFLAISNNLNRATLMNAKLITYAKDSNLEINIDLNMNVCDGNGNFVQNENNSYKYTSQIKNKWYVEEFNSSVFSIETDDFFVKIDENTTIKINENVYAIENKDIKLDYNNVNYNERVISKHLSESVTTNKINPLYLAKLNIIKIDNTFILKSVISNPYKQMIYTNKLLKKLIENANNDSVIEKVFSEVETINEFENPSVKSKLDSVNKAINFKFKIPKFSNLTNNITTGEIEFKIGENFKFGRNFLSSEIDHKLGALPVFIKLGIVMSNKKLIDNDYSDAIYYGSSEVFYKTEVEADINNYQLGSVTYPKKGTFKIGLRVNAGKKNQIIKVRWWAYKENSEIASKNMLKVKIIPDSVNLKINEKFKFNVQVKGDPYNNVIWEVEEGHGIIDEFGKYTAPNKTGIYVVKAISSIDNQFISSAIIKVVEASKLVKSKNKIEKIKLELKSKK